MRLDRLLANLGYVAPARDVQAMIAAGDVVLDGRPARKIRRPRSEADP